MSTIDTIISSFDDSGTLLKWLKKLVEEVKIIDGRGIDEIQLVPVVEGESFKIIVKLRDGTTIESPTIAGGAVSIEALQSKIEGSDYISFDVNEQGTKLVIRLDETMLDDEPTEDSDNLVKSGGVYDALASKQDTLNATQMNAVNSGITASAVARMIKTPVATPTEKQIIGVDTTNSQAQINIDTDKLELTGSTSPYDLTVKDSYVEGKVNGIFRLEGTTLYITTY